MIKKFTIILSMILSLTLLSCNVVEFDSAGVTFPKINTKEDKDDQKDIDVQDVTDKLGSRFDIRMIY